MEGVEFAETYYYDTRLVGITIPIILFDGRKILLSKQKSIQDRVFVFLKEKTASGSNLM